MIKKQTIEYKIVSIIGLAGEIQTEEIYKLSGEEVSKELNPKILEALNIKEETKQETEEIEKTCKIVWIEIDNLLQNLQKIK